MTHLLEKFEQFLQSVDLKSYRDKYRPIKIVEMNLPKEVQAINILYKVYWDQKKFLPFEDFYKEYLSSQKTEIESFRQKITMCQENKELKRFSNGFIVFAPYAFEQKKKEMDKTLK